MSNQLEIEHYWIGENPGQSNAFANILTLLERTSGIKLWTGITSPLFYHPNMITDTCKWIMENHPSRFGLGLGIGNYLLFENLNLEYRKKPLTHFITLTNLILDTLRIGEDKILNNYSTPVAIGGLGNKISDFGISKSNYYLLNSGSYADIDRISKIKTYLISLNQEIPDKQVKEGNYAKIMPYVMLQIFTSKNDLVSPLIWNISKGTAKGLSINILRDHGYDNKYIAKIKKLSWNWDAVVPKGDLLELVRDFAIIGEITAVEEKLAKFRNFYNNNKMSGIVLGWIHSDDKWDELNAVVKNLRMK